jgi:hypothetical protein
VAYAAVAAWEMAMTCTLDRETFPNHHFRVAGALDVVVRNTYRIGTKCQQINNLFLLWQHPCLAGLQRHQPGN